MLNDQSPPNVLSPDMENSEVVGSTEKLTQAVSPLHQDKDSGRGKQKAWFKGHVKFLLRLFCSISLVVVLLKSISWPELWQQLPHLDSGVLLIGVGLGFYGVIISSYQWQCLLAAEQIHIDLRHLINLYQVGIAFNHFLPTGMGGDVVKAYYIGKEGKNTVGSASAVVMTRISGFFAMVLISLPTLIIWHTLLTRQIGISYSLICLALLVALALAFLGVKYIPHWLQPSWLQKRMVQSLLAIGTTLRHSIARPRIMVNATFYGLLYHFGYALNFYLYGRLLNVHVPLSFYLLAIPFVSLVAFVPFSINGFGLREGAFVIIFSSVHVPMPTAMLLILLMDAQVLLFGIIGGVIYLCSGGNKKDIHAPISVRTS
ncbi:hypothetical protein KDA_25130 [Dictyobacter alpinus]|uniref:Dolichol-P-glucose synthetase n=1 Tax=Dictyobacter alpinus TaxID=2014873 RepID=A0A402B6S0_9CHLR|nr:lysylphosphatidylglycerol synthase transmembrane domain-containing protein [Dictyobacter alpinus]GCE27029.1 hypothetical protein KDA_25130 [Dictyobacter alpinus]